MPNLAEYRFNLPGSVISEVDVDRPPQQRIVQHSATVNPRISLQVVEVVHELVEVGILSPTRTLDLMNLTGRANKIDLDPTDLNLLTPTRITPLMKKLPEKNQIGGFLHLKPARKQPEFSLANEIVIHLGAREV